jgi:release factor glutamine methyltransferase
MATDISPGALEAASCNAREYGVAARLELVRTSWLDGLAGCFDLIISNPPYLSAGEIEGLTPEVKDWDPRRALDGGSDGLDCYRAIAEAARDHLNQAGAVILEIGHEQQGQVTEILAESGFEREAAYRDLAGHVRCLVFGIRKMGVGNASNLSYIPTR